MREQRLQAMTDFISQRQTVSLKTLAETFAVSLYTVRRDIDVLVKRSQLRKHYGGVTAQTAPTAYPVFFAEREPALLEEKQHIANLAVADVTDGDIIYIDAGTTAMRMATALKNRTLTVVTNSLPVILELSSSPAIELIVLGGQFDERTAAFCGLSALETVERFKFDKAFLGTTGLSIEHGLTNYTALEAALKRAVMQRSDGCYLLADHTKFGRDSVHRIGPLSQIHVLVSNRPLPPDFVQFCKEHTIRIVHDAVA